MFSAQEILDAKNHLTPDEYLKLMEHINSISLPDISFVDFVREGWSFIEPSVPYKHNWHIEVIADYLEAVVWGKVKNLIINIPPRYMKSTLVAVCFQPWTWTFRPWTKWLFYSHSATYSMRDTVASRRLIAGDWYQSRWDVRLSKDQNTKSKYENLHGGVRSALGIGGSTGDGGDFIIGDDLLNIDARHSAPKREGVNNFWATTVATRKNTSSTATVIIAQRLHEHDIVGFLDEKKNEGGAAYEKLVIPAEYNEAQDEAQNKTGRAVEWEDPRTEQNELLWPARFDRHEVDQLKRSLGSDSAALLQQTPTPATGNIFKKHWLKFWQYKGQNLPPPVYTNEEFKQIECEVLTLPDEFISQLQSWDTTFKGTKTSAYAVGQVWGKTKAEMFLLDQTRKKMGFVEFVDAVRDLSVRWPEAHTKLIEDKANGSAVIDTLKRELRGLIPINPKGDKVSRANAVSPLFEAGNVYLPHPQNAEWVYDLIIELASFPNSEYADQVDALTQALMRLRKSGWSR